MQIIKEKINNKEYYDCVKILRQAILENLIKKMQEYNKEFKYTTTKDLYNKSKKTNNEDLKKLTLQLFKLDISENSAEEDIYYLMEIYRELNNISNL